MTAKNNMEDTSPSKDTSKELTPSTKLSLIEQHSKDNLMPGNKPDANASKTVAEMFDGKNPLQIAELEKTAYQDPNYKEVLKNTGNEGAAQQRDEMDKLSKKTPQQESDEAIKHGKVLARILGNFPHGMNYKDIVKCLDDNLLYSDTSVAGASPGRTLTKEERAALQYAKEHYGDITPSSKEGDAGVLEIKDISPYVTRKAYEASHSN